MTRSSCFIVKYKNLSHWKAINHQNNSILTSNKFDVRNMSNGVPSEKYDVLHDEKNRQFVIQLDPKDEHVIANLTYEFEEETSEQETKKLILNLISTNVPKRFKGKGIAKILALAAFEHCANHNKRMKLTCWYLVGYLNRNPNPRYNKLVHPKL